MLDEQQVSHHAEHGGPSWKPALAKTEHVGVLLGKGFLVKSFRIQRVTIKKPHCMKLVYIISQIFKIFEDCNYLGLRNTFQV